MASAMQPVVSMQIDKLFQKIEFCEALEQFVILKTLSIFNLVFHREMN